MASPGINAGITFSMLRGIEPFLNGMPERVVICERLHQLISGANKVAEILPELRQIVEKLEKIAANFN